MGISGLVAQTLFGWLIQRQGCCPRSCSETKTRPQHRRRATANDAARTRSRPVAWRCTLAALEDEEGPRSFPSPDNQRRPGSCAASPASPARSESSWRPPTPTPLPPSSSAPMDALEGLPPPAPILNGGPGIVSLPEDFAAALVSSASAVLSSAASSSIAIATPSAIAWSSAASMEGAAVTTGVAGVAGSTKDSLLKSIAMELPSPDVDAESCQLLGPFALLIQALMGVIVLGSLLVKRQRERPRSASTSPLQLVVC